MATTPLTLLARGPDVWVARVPRPLFLAPRRKPTRDAQHSVGLSHALNVARGARHSRRGARATQPMFHPDSREFANVT